MKNIFMSMMVCLSCLSHGYSLTITISLTALSVIWFGFFEYVKLVVKRKGEYPPFCSNNLKYMSFVLLFALMHPVLCLMFVFFFHPFYLSKCLRLTTQMNPISVRSSRINPRRCGNDSSFAQAELYFPFVASGKVISGNSSYCLNDFSDSLSDIDREGNSINNTSGSGCEIYMPSVPDFNGCISDINPASGLSMISDVDVCGNPYGINSHTDY
ncbi:hypothetical protein [Klebsiella variicola]|uniref:hypothetical protein n=1 Tax=Klebsiella variicola TaxID=244366 RepID=UPI0034DDF18A